MVDDILTVTVTLDANPIDNQPTHPISFQFKYDANKDTLQFVVPEFGEGAITLDDNTNPKAFNLYTSLTLMGAIIGVMRRFGGSLSDILA